MNVHTDNEHCGECFASCDPGTVCSEGQCTVSCQNGLTECHGTCVNLATDNWDCGACGHECEAGKLCSAGSCELSCLEGLTECDGLCVNLETDRDNCGACAKQCDEGNVCSAGECAISCQQELSLCGQTCVNLQTDSRHCGTCDHTCNDGEVCSDGACRVSCQNGLTNCNDVCVNTQTDNTHCGDCTTVCGAGEVCSAGTCQVSCQAPLVECEGVCTNPSNDPNHCGGCAGAEGVVCTANEHQTAVCVAGVCSAVCETGYLDCDADESNGCEVEEASLLTDSEHCGACDQACNSDETCHDGECLSGQALDCLAQGGTLGTNTCCIGAGNFPNTCAAGACGCSSPPAVWLWTSATARVACATTGKTAFRSECLPAPPLSWQRGRRTGEPGTRNREWGMNSNFSAPGSLFTSLSQAR